MPEDLEALKKAAEGATPGPWEVPESIHGDPYITERGVGILRGGCVAVADTRDDYGRSNAAYIAAASPDVVLALVERVERAEGAVAALREAFDPGELECGRLGLSCADVNPADRWCRACRLRAALGLGEVAS